MKTAIRSAAAAVSLLLLAAGCVDFDYQGESFEAVPESETALYAPGAKVPADLAVIGQAVVSGDYQNISRDRLEARLREEAADRGATAVRLVSIQVLPEDAAAHTVAERIDPIETNTNQISPSVRRDFDGGYGTASYTLLGDRVETAPPVASRSYRRIIRAEFLRPKSE